MGGRPEAPVLLLVAGVCANENGLARRPPMGWRSWNLFGAAVDQRLMERVMAGLVDRSRLVAGAPTRRCFRHVAVLRTGEAMSACVEASAMPASLAAASDASKLPASLAARGDASTAASDASQPPAPLAARGDASTAASDASQPPAPLAAASDASTLPAALAAATLRDGAAAAGAPAPAFVDLTPFVDAAVLDDLDDYLEARGVAGAGGADGAETMIFAAEGRKYGDAVELCDRDTSAWCMDAFYARGPKDDFKKCRAYRGDPRTWRPNHNARALPGVADRLRRLGLLERMGKTAIILNARNSAGVEHADHALPDLVSEFVWLRPRASTKRFYVRDDAGAKRFLGPHVRAAWFDDHRRHCIEPVDADGQVSIRVDGRFAPDVRARLVASGAFAANLPGYDGAAVLAAQGGTTTTQPTAFYFNLWSTTPPPATTVQDASMGPGGDDHWNPWAMNVEGTL